MTSNKSDLISNNDIIYPFDVVQEAEDRGDVDTPVCMNSLEHITEIVLIELGYTELCSPDDVYYDDLPF